MLSQIGEEVDIFIEEKKEYIEKVAKVLLSEEIIEKERFLRLMQN